MFDFRYHALSLIAVFVALLLGLLLGVAIGDQGLVSGAERKLRKSLRHDVNAARADAARLRNDLQDRDRVEQSLYPLIVQGRLANQRVGLIAFGSLPDRTIKYVRDALQDTGGRLTLEAVVREPVRLDGLSPRDTGAGAKPLSQDPAQVTRFAQRFGADLTQGGRLVGRVRRALLESSSGSFDGLEAVVVVHQSPPQGTGQQAGIDRAFEAGLVTGLSRNTVPVVGAELSSTQPSQVSWYKAHDLSSVDSIDKLPGRVALVFALAGASGTYGTKSTAEALLPNAPGRAPRT